MHESTGRLPRPTFGASNNEASSIAGATRPALDSREVIPPNPPNRFPLQAGSADCDLCEAVIAKLRFPDGNSMSETMSLG